MPGTLSANNCKVWKEEQGWMRLLVWKDEIKGLKCYPKNKRIEILPKPRIKKRCELEYEILNSVEYEDDIQIYPKRS